MRLEFHTSTSISSVSKAHLDSFLLANASAQNTIDAFAETTRLFDASATLEIGSWEVLFGVLRQHAYTLLLKKGTDLPSPIEHSSLACSFSQADMEFFPKTEQPLSNLLWATGLLIDMSLMEAITLAVAAQTDEGFEPAHWRAYQKILPKVHKQLVCPLATGEHSPLSEPYQDSFFREALQFRETVLELWAPMPYGRPTQVCRADIGITLEIDKDGHIAHAPSVSERPGIRLTAIGTGPAKEYSTRDSMPVRVAIVCLKMSCLSFASCREVPAKEHNQIYRSCEFIQP